MPSRTSTAATAAACCIRWATTPSGCRPRTTRSRPVSTRATRPRRRSPSSSSSSASGDLDRLVARVRDLGAPLLPLDPVDLPAPVRARPGLPQGGRGQLVPQGRDRARQRAGDRRPLRALRHARRGAPARAVVLPHHRLRRAAARRSRGHRLARARRHDAAQLDRPLRGRRGHVPLRGARARLPRLHHAAGHAVRRDVLRHGPRAPGRAAAGAGDRVRGRGPRVREPLPDRGPRRARRRPPREDGRPARPHGRRTRSTASRSPCSSPTTC